MNEVTIRKPRCFGRPCCHTHSASVAQKLKGAYLTPGCRYCTGGKKIRVFKKNDPKVYVPSWCPHRNTPSILRIYHYRNANVAFLRSFLDSGKEPCSPNPFDYAPRHTGTTTLSASSFYEDCEFSRIHELLGEPVHINEIIEIDDGLTPYCFLIDELFHVRCVNFDGERARKNKLEDWDA